jgi:hypothetical protein
MNRVAFSVSSFVTRVESSLMDCGVAQITFRWKSGLSVYISERPVVRGTAASVRKFLGFGSPDLGARRRFLGPLFMPGTNGWSSHRVQPGRRG